MNWNSPGETAISTFLIKRLAGLLAALLAASVVVFAVLDILPGNAAEVMLGESATPEAVRALSAKLGLDRPAPLRYASWLRGLLVGELGRSVAYDTPIAVVSSIASTASGSVTARRSAINSAIGVS